MIKAMRIPCASGMHHRFAWVFIFCFTVVVSIAESESMQLQIPPHVTARCGDNVPLPCSFISSNQNDMKLVTFSLLADNETKVCKYGHDKADRDYHCVSTNETSNQTLTMTLINIMPVSEGKYICKLYTNKGVASNRTYVKVEDCCGSSDNFRNASQATCVFSGVYPSGVVHWFWRGDNITEAAITKEKKDQHGLYSISSTVRKEEDKLNDPYNCSLWIPSLNKYLSSQEVKTVKSSGTKEVDTVKSSGTKEVKEVKSSGTTVKLQWICIVVEILMLRFRM